MNERFEDSFANPFTCESKARSIISVIEKQNLIIRSSRFVLMFCPCMRKVL